MAFDTAMIGKKEASASAMVQCSLTDRWHTLQESISFYIPGQEPVDQSWEENFQDWTSPDTEDCTWCNTHIKVEELPAAWTYLRVIDYDGRRRGIEEFTEFVGFSLANGREGISLQSALDKSEELDMLEEGDQEAYDKKWGVASKNHFRLQFEGCSPYQRQIAAMRATAQGGSISRKTLAHEIAGEVKQAIKGTAPQHKGRPIELKYLRLLAFKRVAKGSWQPVIKINETELFREQPGMLCKQYQK
ncbi:uncharacterized protein BXZ73DRAFT_79319 [Epithele typhae]|uniref:uncharacterized protein n=1 Tax=Epithele typhae TaxID=378194 RepID=UPI002008AB10|nr:uncharacterized protein BXZ73DRAFT_79319 [Epithele typhae]KAH9923913.1 hypothetical protein BXZ73DRAFT_79319 [Epithele typhae]